MFHSEEIGKLVTFFRPEEKTSSLEHMVDIELATDYQILARILLESELATPRLNRKGVTELLAGQLSWPKDDDSEYKKKIDVTPKLLEKMGMVNFYADYCHVICRDLPNKEEIDASCHPIEEAVTLLSDITCGGNNFTKPHFKIHNKRLEKISNGRALPKILEHKQSSEYILILDITNQNSDLFAIFLWKELIVKLGITPKAESFKINELDEEQQGLLKHWVLIARVFKYLFLTDVNFQFLPNLHKKVYQAFFINEISQDVNLHCSLNVLENQWISSFSVRTLFIDRQPTNEVTKLPISKIQEKLAAQQSKAFDSNIAFYKHTKSMGQDATENDNYYSWPLEKIIRSTLYCTQNSVDTMDDSIPVLLDLADKHDSLKYMLFHVSINTVGIKFWVYLLTKRNTAIIALYMFLDGVGYNSLVAMSRKYRPYLEYLPSVCSIFNQSFLSTTQSEGPCKPLHYEQLAELIGVVAQECITPDCHEVCTQKKQCLEILLNSLLPSQVELLTSPLISFVIDHKPKHDYGLPVSKFYLLFWLLSRIQTISSKEMLEAAAEVQRYIIKFYVEAFKTNLGEQSHGMNACNLMDTFEWSSLDDQCIPELLNLVNPKRWISCISAESNGQFDNVRIARSYLQVLLQVFHKNRDEKIKKRITNQAIALAINCGYSDNPNESFIFGYEYQGDYPLWEAFISFMEKVEDVFFTQLLNDLEETSIPMDKLLQLGVITLKHSRKEKVLTIVREKNITCQDDQIGLQSLEDALDSACRIGEFDLANTILQQACKIIENTESYFNSHTPKAKKEEQHNRWELYQYKLGLLSIRNKRELSDTERLGELSALQNPFNRNTQPTFYKNGNLFLRAMSGHILFNSEPAKAYKYFDSLYKEHPILNYAESRFAAKLKFLEDSKSHKENDYRCMLAEWEQALGSETIHDLAAGTIANWLTSFKLMKKWQDGEQLWAKLLHRQRMHVTIATAYCGMLQEIEEHDRAYSILTKLKVFHQVDTLTDDAEKQLTELESKITSKQPIDQMITSIINSAQRPKSNHELWDSVNQLKSKSLPELVKIIGEPNTETVETFLYKQIYSILGEIQLRKKGLNVKDSNSESKRIAGEDLVNDWVTSFFDQRHACIGLSCRDQKRGGQAKSKLGVGEIDFFLCDRDNNRIAIMEAFNLKGIERTVIAKHLDKIAGYDQQCLSPVFIIVYCYYEDFNTLCNKYQQDIKHRQYEGFDNSDNQADTLTEKEPPSSTLACYKEVRFRNEKPITFYHMLVNLNFA